MAGNKLTIIFLVIIFLCSGCSAGDDSSYSKTNTDNLQEISLPVENALISSMKIDGEGKLTLVEANNDEKANRIWKLTENGKWEKVFETDYIFQENENEVIELTVDVVEDIVVEKKYAFDKEYHSPNDLQMRFISNGQIIGEVDSLSGYLFTDLYSIDGNNIFMKEVMSQRLYCYNVQSGQLNVACDISDIVSATYVDDMAYIIYRQPYELTEEEVENLTPDSNFPEQYARGIVLNLNTGEMKESDVLDALAVRYFECWNMNQIFPAWCPAADQNGEAYYLAHNSGIFRIDGDGEELVAYDKTWENSAIELDKIAVDQTGKIYLYIMNTNSWATKLVEVG